MIVRNPEMLCQPWVLHYFPSMTLDRFERGEWTIPLYVGMWDFIQTD